MMKPIFRLSLYSLSTAVTLLVGIQCVFICAVLYFTKPSIFSFGSKLWHQTELKLTSHESSEEIPQWYPYESGHLHNTSFCNFKFGTREKFDLSNASASPSVELGPQSPYNVIYNVVEGFYQVQGEEDDGVTYCTHATPTYIHHIVELARRWDGPISIALFVPGYDAATSLLIVDQLCRCFQEMEKVSFHFVYPVLHPPELGSLYRDNKPVVDFNSECTLPDSLQRGTLKTYRTDNDLIYPVNVHRNAARHAATTTHILVSDIELLPSINFVPSFMKMLKKYTWNERHVYVLPVFEVEKTVRSIPKTKRQLQRLYGEGEAVYFHRWVCLHCQLFRGLLQWIHAQPTADLQPMSVVRRRFPYHRWEPIFVGTQQEPWYDELLSWEGRQDKMIQLHTMCLLDYQFVILNNAFLVHVPGIKRRSVEDNTKRKRHIISNQRLYSLIGRRMEQKLHRVGKQICPLS